MVSVWKRVCMAVLAVMVVVAPAKADDADKAEDTKKPIPVNVGLFSWPGYGFWFVAAEKNLVPEIELKIQVIEDPYQTFALMEAGQIDVAASTAEYAPLAAAEGNIIRLVAYTNVSYGTDKIILGPGQETAKDLVGKTVAVLEGGLSQIYMAIWLEENGVKFDEVTFSNLIMDDATAAMISGQVAGGAFWEPFGGTVLETLEGSKAVETSDIEKWTSIGLLADSLYMTETFISEKPQAAKLALKAWFAAVDFWRENPEEANAIIAKALGFPKEDVVTVIGDTGEPKRGGILVYGRDDVARFMGVTEGDPELGNLGLKNDGMKEHFALTAGWWEKFGLIDAVPPYEAGVDLRPLGDLQAATASN